MLRAARVGLAILLSQALAAEAAEIKVLSSNAIRPALQELFSDFERQTGHKVATQYEGSLAAKRRIQAGAAFDVAIVSFDVDELIKLGKIDPRTRVVLGYTGVGVAVRQGASKPDISTTEAFKRTLLNAQSVAYSRGSSGVYFLALLDRLGIAADMKSKLRPQLEGNTVDAVTSGGAEMAVSGVVTITGVPGVQLVGSLPSELQTYVVFTAGVSAAAKHAAAGRDLLRFLAKPAAVAVFKAKGLEPGTPPSDEKPYRVSSKEVGWDSIDLTIQEQRREDRISSLEIPHYATRSSVESRFAMCAFTDIAIQRRFAVWIVSDEPVTDDVVHVGFLKTEDENVAKVLGEHFVGDKAFRAEVRVINRLCGIEIAK